MSSKKVKEPIRICKGRVRGEEACKEDRVNTITGSQIYGIDCTKPCAENSDLCATCKRAASAIRKNPKAVRDTAYQGDFYGNFLPFSRVVKNIPRKALTRRASNAPASGASNAANYSSNAAGEMPQSKPTRVLTAEEQVYANLMAQKRKINQDLASAKKAASDARTAAKSAAAAAEVPDAKKAELQETMKSKRTTMEGKKSLYEEAKKAADTATEVYKEAEKVFKSVEKEFKAAEKAYKDAEKEFKEAEKEFKEAEKAYEKAMGIHKPQTRKNSTNKTATAAKSTRKSQKKAAINSNVFANTAPPAVGSSNAAGMLRTSSNTRPAAGNLDVFGVLRTSSNALPAGSSSNAAGVNTNVFGNTAPPAGSISNAAGMLRTSSKPNTSPAGGTTAALEELSF